MQLKGKKVLFLGDSITEGVGVSSPDKKYTSVFERLSGAIVYNYGISGTRIATQKNPTVTNPRFDLTFGSRVQDMNPEGDIIVVFGGTNDYGHGDASIGVFSDRDEYSFYGALHNLIVSLVSKYPDATVVFMTPLHRDFENETKSLQRGFKPVLKEYVKAIREVCEYYSIPVLDLYASSGLQPAIPVIKQKFMPDGLHPSDAGAEIIAQRLYGFLNAL